MKCALRTAWWFCEFREGSLAPFRFMADIPFGRSNHIMKP